MDKYIKESDLFKRILNVDFKHDYDGCIKFCQSIPAADVVEVRHGRWTIETIHEYELAYGTTAYEPVYKCSCCGLLTESYLRLDEPIMPDDADFPKWCGNCGASMDEVEDEQ